MVQHNCLQTLPFVLGSSVVPTALAAGTLGYALAEYGQALYTALAQMLYSGENKPDHPPENTPDQQPQKPEDPEKGGPEKDIAKSALFAEGARQGLQKKPPENPRWDERYAGTNSVHTDPPIVRGQKILKSKNIPASSINAQKALHKKLKRLEKSLHQSEKTRYLPDGRNRYYTKEKPANVFGETRGRATVTEHNPKTGDVRIWEECYDQSGNVNRVHPKFINGQDINSTHYPLTGKEKDFLQLQ